MFTAIACKDCEKPKSKTTALSEANSLHNETRSRTRAGHRRTLQQRFYRTVFLLAVTFLLLRTSLSEGQDMLHGKSPPTQVPSPLIDGSGEELMNEEEDQEAFSQTPPIHYRLEKFLMDNYNPKLIPRRNKKRPISVHFSIGLYQIIERWKDDLLYWKPEKFDGVNEIVLPREDSWIPDTTLYNSLVMNDAESRRLSSVKITTLKEEKTALVEMLYPTLYKFSCMLDLRFFPFDVQHCVMTFGSWTHDNKAIDYHPHNGTAGGAIGTEHCIENEGWNILSTDVLRREEKFQCCVNNYTLLDFYLHIQRKPLFYLVNLIIPTSVITLIAIVGFFSSSTVNDLREEKISLGITTLLSMSILIFMVSDQMPSTSSFIPLIGWFYTSMMMLISGGTLAASSVIYIQKKGIVGQRPSSRTMRWARRLGKLILMEMPLLMKQAYALKAKQDKLNKQQLAAALAAASAQKQARQSKPDQRDQFMPNHQEKNHRKQSVWSKWQKISKDMNFVPNCNNIPHHSCSGVNGPNTSSAMTSFLAYSSAQAMAFAAPPLPHQSASRATNFWSHFGRGGSNGREEPAPATDSSSTPKNSLGSATAQQKEEESLSLADGGMGTSVSFVEEPKMHSYTNDTDFSIEYSEKEEQPAQLVVNAAPPAPTDPSTDNSFWATPNADTNPNSLSQKFRKKSAVAAVLAAFANSHSHHEQLCSSQHFNSDPSNPYGYLPLQAQIQIANASSGNGASFQRTNSNLNLGFRPPPLFRKATSNSISDVYNSLMDPVTSSTSGASNLAAAAAAAQLHGSQMQRNLAEIEYDWLAAVVERLFLLMFCTLFFLMSFGINGIGLYYWYFTTVDTIEHS